MSSIPVGYVSFDIQDVQVDDVVYGFGFVVDMWVEDKVVSSTGEIELFERVVLVRENLYDDEFTVIDFPINTRVRILMYENLTEKNEHKALHNLAVSFKKADKTVIFSSKQK